MWPRRSAQSLRQRATELGAEAEHSAQVRALSTHPDVVALQVERVRGQVNRLMWTGIVLGMAFCMTNVQEFAAEGSEPWSPGWLAAWLLDPMASLVLIAVVLAEQTTSRWQLATPSWARRARWATLAATYAMNTWKAWAELDPAKILLHSVPPLIVFVATEAAPELRDRLTSAVQTAAATGPAGREAHETVADAAAAAGIVASPTTPPTGLAPSAPAMAEASEVDEECGPDQLSPTDPETENRRWEREELLAADSDTRVEQVMDLILGGLKPSVDLTGHQVGLIFGQSARTGRRVIEDAERRLPLGQDAAVTAEPPPAPEVLDEASTGQATAGAALVLVGAGATDRVEVGA